MPELTLIYDKQLDDSQLCPVCKAAMYFIEGEYYQKEIKFHQCSYCQHCIFYDQQPFSCHCTHCEQERQRLINQTKFDERKYQWQKKRKQQDNTEFLLDDLALLDKLFLFSLLHITIKHTTQHDEFITLNQYPAHIISPSYQLYKKLCQHFIQADYLKSYHEQQQQYFPNIRLIGYREPSLQALYQQLEAWFYGNFQYGVPYKDQDEVLNVLITLLVHELIHYCQYCCQKYGVFFSAEKNIVKLFEELLKSLAVTQIYYLIHKAIKYLAEHYLLDKTNQDFKNTNLVRKTLLQYRERGLQESWETSNLNRPADLPLSIMSDTFLNHFLKFKQQAFIQPIWKSWHDIVPRLNFFTERHCIHCGSKDLSIEYNTKNYVSFTCQNCKQQDHYFIK